MNSQQSQQTQQLQMIQMIQQINNSLPGDKQIKSILFLYSNFSEKCKMIINSLEDFRNMFHFICIDNKKIRQKIIKSKKISEVPCVIIVDVNSSVFTYEGEKITDIIKMLISSLQNQSQDQSQNLSQNENQSDDQNEQQSNEITPITSVLQNESIMEDTNELIEETLGSTKRSSMVDPSDMVAGPSSQGVKRTKIKKNNPSQISDDGNILATVGREPFQPPKGKGHEKLAVSSLKKNSKKSSNMETFKTPNRTSNTEAIKNETLNRQAFKQSSRNENIEELDDVLTDVTNNVNDKDDDNCHSVVDRKKNMNDIKKIAMEMQMGREDEDGDE